MCDRMARTPDISRLRIIRGSLIFMGFLIPLSASPDRAEVIVGISSGINIPGDQDQTFREYNAQRELIDFRFIDRLGEEMDLLSGIAVSVWGNHGTFRQYGIQLDVLYWRLTTRAAGFTPDDAPPFTSLEQERLALFINALYRVPLVESGADAPLREQTYVLAGVGAGPVTTNLRNGQRQTRGGYQLLGGLSVPLRRNFRFRIEGRYLLAPDLGAEARPGWQVETSGTPTLLRLGPHRDTRFVGILVGIDLLLR